MNTLKEQLAAEAVENSNPPAPKIIHTVEAPVRFGNPYRAEYLKSAEAIKEKLLKRGKPARPSKKSKMR